MSRARLSAAFLALGVCIPGFAQTLRFGEIHEGVPRPPMGVDVVLAADLNGDGAADLLRQDGVLFNDGGGRFPAAGTMPGGLFSYVVCAVAVDLDFDGDLDLVHTDGSPSGVAVAWNLGAGQFGPGPSLAAPAGWATQDALFVGDFDGDGAPDLASVAVHGTTQALAGVVWFHAGGAFTPSIVSTGSGGTTPVGAGDVDGDGEDEMLVDDHGPGPQHVFRIVGWSNGAWVAGSPLAAPADLAVARLADWNGDGYADLVLVDAAFATPTAATERFFVGGVGGLVASIALGVGDVPYRLLPFDLDGVAPLEALRESGSELAVGGVVGAAPPRLSVPLVAREGAAPLCGDFDMDGDVDLLAMTSSYGVRLAFNDGQGALVAPDGVIPARFAAERRASVAADVDGDGDVDLVSVAFNEVALNDGHGRFVATPTTPPATLPPAAPGLGFAADFDLDGAEDVFWHHGSSGGVVTYGAPDLAFTATSAPTLQPRSVVAGDVDQDGDLDLLVTEEAPAALRLLLNGGRSAWTAITIDAGSPVRDAALVDLDGDGDLDAAVATRSPFSPASIAPSRFYINQGGGTFVQQTAPFTIEADAVAVGDLDGDGDLDLVFDGAGFLRTSGGWVAGGPAATGVDFLGAAVVDADEDGFGDLLCGAGAFAGAGSGGFGALQPWPAPFDYVPWPYGLWAPIPRMRAVDLDGDGDKDVVGLRPAPFVNLRRQLVLEDRPRPGRDATLVLFGAAGETGYFGFAPQLAAAPFVVPGWGAVHLDLGALTILGPSVLDGEGRSVLAVSVPQQPSLVGTWLWWQGALLGSGKLTGALRATVLGL